MRVAIVQMQIDAVSRAHNQRRAFDLIASAAEREPTPEVICLPARCEGGGVFRGQDPKFAAPSETFLEVIAAQTKEMGVSLVVGLSESDGEHIYDSAVWCDADGDIVAKHRRMTLTNDEPKALVPGSRATVAHTLFGKVGLLVSDDVCNEHVVASLAQAGATVIFAPCHWPKSDTYYARAGALAREHQTWMVLANSVGSGGGDGQSRIIDSHGRIVCTSDTSQEEVLGHHIDLEIQS